MRALRRWAQRQDWTITHPLSLWQRGRPAPRRAYVQDDSGEDEPIYGMTPEELVSAGVEVPRDWPEQRREGL